MSENVVTEALVNKKTGEVVEIGLQKTPDEIMLDASAAAKTLEKLIKQNKKKPLEFNGKFYLEYPHWQTIAKFYHTTAGTGEAAYMEIGGIQGFKAHAQVLDEKTGLVVGGAEAYCMKDEPNWKHKPLFQLASMAQTRAAAKALSNKYRYVAILAGYEQTPAEEADMAMERGLRAPKALEPADEFRRAPAPRAEPAPASIDRFITEAQRKKLFATAHARGIDEDELRRYLKERFEIEHTTSLRFDQFDEVLKWLDSEFAE